MATATRTVAELCASAKQASRGLATATTQAKEAALVRLAGLLGERSGEILEANAADLADERAAASTTRSAIGWRSTPKGSARWPQGWARSRRCLTRSAR